MAEKATRRYRPTESKYKGGASEVYITYDLPQKPHGGGQALYPKVKRVYVSGDLKDWEAGTFTKRTGKSVHGVKIEHTQTRTGYKREGFEATRGRTEYTVAPASVKPAVQTFTQVVEVPDMARNIKLHKALPARYKQAVQDIR